jgi:hypothetical protein
MPWRSSVAATGHGRRWNRLAGVHNNLRLRHDRFSHDEYRNATDFIGKRLAARASSLDLSIPNPIQDNLLHRNAVIRERMVGVHHRDHETGRPRLP